MAPSLGQDAGSGSVPKGQVGDDKHDNGVWQKWEVVFHGKMNEVERILKKIYGELLDRYWCRLVVIL